LFKWLGLCSEKFELCPSMLFSSADGSLSEWCPRFCQWFLSAAFIIRVIVG
jgi:hypothetical protein